MGPIALTAAEAEALANRATLLASGGEIVASAGVHRVGDGYIPVYDSRGRAVYEGTDPRGRDVFYAAGPEGKPGTACAEHWEPLAV